MILLSMQFPTGFLWGAATSAHQIEGGNINDWSEWEHEKAPELARNYKLRYRFKAQLGLKYPRWAGFDSHASKPENYVSAQASNSYQDWQKDIELLQKLNLNSYRFSIEWSRIEPEFEQWQESELNHYEQIINSLLTAGIEPVVTLWHYTLPKWFYHEGGWLSARAADKFCTYVEKVVNRFAGKVKYWLTMNEPVIYLNLGYLTGEIPPGRIVAPFRYLKLFNKLIEIHKSAYASIHSIDHKAQVGLAQNIVYFQAANGQLFNKLLKSGLDWWVNYRFLNQVSNCLDFIGLNHYFHNLINYGINKNKYDWVNDMGWEIYPKAIYEVLMELKRFAKPIIITESGTADRKDVHRPDFLRQTLSWVNRAIAKGVDVRGYLHWSLIDNFEWSDGFWPRFGLAEVNYNNFERTIRPSGKWYGEVARRNGW